MTPFSEHLKEELMNTSRITGALAAIALVIAIVPTARGEETKQVRRVVVVKDGQVVTSDGAALPRLTARGFFGVQTIDLTPELREHFRVQKDAGVLVGKVVPDSPAAKAGIQVGDIITAIDGAAVGSPGDVARAVRDKKKGNTLRIDYTRNGANATAVATAVEREMKVVDLSDLDIQIPDIQIPDVGRHMEQYFNSPEWKAKMERLQQLPDCGDMRQRMRQLESKMKDLEKRLGQK
jgi:membrane-associated protease RseP (regulator of RpoE activity)